MPVLRDPNGAYRNAIKAALIDAMLDHSRGMNIQPDEWLTVAAHRGDSSFGPSEIVNSSTLVLNCLPMGTFFRYFTSSLAVNMKRGSIGSLPI